MNEQVKEETTQEVENKLRFTVGQDYLFIHIDFDTAVMSFSNLYRPWLGDTLKTTDIIKLACKEHHKVYWTYDEPDGNPKHDGFVFKDKEDKDWYNQYPKAEYGQLDDSADRMVSSATPPEDKSAEWKDYTLITTYLSRVADGISNFNKKTDKETPEELEMRPKAAASLQIHFDEVAEKLKNEFGMKVELEPYSFQVTKQDTGESETIEVPHRHKVKLVPL